MIQILAFADAEGRVTPSTARQDARSRVFRPANGFGHVLAYADAAGHVYAEWDESKHPRDQDGRWVEDMFHGTAGRTVKKILQEGLKPGSGEKIVYATTEKERALSFAYHKVITWGQDRGLSIKKIEDLRAALITLRPRGEVTTSGVIRAISNSVPKNDILKVDLYRVGDLMHSSYLGMGKVKPVASFGVTNLEEGLVYLVITPEFLYLGIDDIRVLSWDEGKQIRNDKGHFQGIRHPLYVSRPVLNADAIIAWAKSVGFATTLPAEDMHVTVCYSKEPVDWLALEHWADTLEVPPEGVRILAWDESEHPRAPAGSDKGGEFESIGVGAAVTVVASGRSNGRRGFVLRVDKEGYRSVWTTKNRITQQYIGKFKPAELKLRDVSPYEARSQKPSPESDEPTKLEQHNHADRTITNLGDDGAVVLQFDSAPLQARHRYFLDQGASWDYNAYHPHITLTYAAPEVLDLSTVEPYTGKIVLGPEQFTELETGWAEDIKEQAQEEAGVWRTIRGRRVFIREGEDLDTALNRSLGNWEENKWKGIISGEWPDPLSNAELKQVREFARGNKVSLTGEEGKAIIEYRRQGAFDINPKLRLGKELMPEQSRMVAALDKAIRKARLSAEVTVFRGDDAGMGKKRFKVGEIIDNKAYTATTFDPEKALNFSMGPGKSNTVFRIQVPKGFNGLYVEGRAPAGLQLGGGPEHELLLPRGTKFRVVEALHKGNTNYVTLEAQKSVIGAQKYSQFEPIEIDCAQIKNDLDAMEAKFRDELREVITQSRDAMMAQVRKGKAGNIKELKLPYTTDIQGVIRTALQRAMDRGEADASKEIGRAKKEYTEAQDGKWITMNGRHVFIKEGETPEQALEKVKQSGDPDSMTRWREKILKAGGSKEILNSMSPGELKALRDYTLQSHYEDLNRALREGLLTAEQEKFKNDLMSAIKKLPESDGQTVRGTPRWHGPAPKVGQIMEDKAFTSTSPYGDVADKFSKGKGSVLLFYRYGAGKGHQLGAFSMFSGERETLRPPGQKYLIDKVSKAKGGRTIVYLSAPPKQMSVEEVLELPYVVYASAPTFTPRAALKWLRAKVFWVADVLTGGLLEDIRLAIINGLKIGKPTSEIVTDIAQVYIPYLGDPTAVKDGELPTAARLETVVRTNITESYNQGRLATFVKPDMMPFLDGIRYSAILDTRTTPVCRYLHERIFKPEEIQATGLVPPNHFSCRSLVVPLVVGEISKPPDFKVDPKVYITDEEILHAQALADAKFLEQVEDDDVHTHEWDESRHPRDEQGQWATIGIPKQSTESPKLHLDNPGGDWLAYERERSSGSGRDAYGAPNRWGEVTGSFSDDVLIPIDKLSQVPGLRGEQQNVRQGSLEDLMSHMKEKGRLPLGRLGGEYVPFIQVAYDGSAWMNEGNHRVMAAKALGWKYLPVEIRYFAGGEQAGGEWSPEKLLGEDAALRKVKRYAQEEAGVWRTVRGRKVFIREGETPTEAVKRSIAERAARSIQSHIPATKARQLKAAQYEETVAKLIAGKNLDDHEPFDVIKGQHAVEVKVLISGKNAKVTMHPDSLARKTAFLRKEKMTGHTVVIDARGPKPVYYYREGVGSFRLNNMRTVKGAELKGLIGRQGQYAVDDEGHQGEWKTINGRHTFIREGETPEQSLSRSIDRSEQLTRYRKQILKVDPSARVVMDSMSDGELRALESYTSAYAGYDSLNKALRDGVLTVEQTKFRDALESAIKKLPRSEGQTVRGISWSGPLPKVGQMVEDKAFTSTTPYGDVAEKFGKGKSHVQFIYRYGAGFGYRLGPFAKYSENEVLRPPGQKYLVDKVSVGKKSGKRVVFLSAPPKQMSVEEIIDLPYRD